VQGDEIANQYVAENIFDTAVNMGVRTASKLVQITLDVKPADGIIGPQTLKAINQANPEMFLAKFTLAKIARYANICNRNKSSRKFLLGWINRALGAA
jgi:lysozyme family protein